MYKNKSEFGFFLVDGVVALSFLLLAAFGYFYKLLFNLYLLSVIVIGLYFYSSYHYRIIMRPLYESCGRLEGRIVETRRINDLMKKGINRRKKK